MKIHCTSTPVLYRKLSLKLSWLVIIGTYREMWPQYRGWVQWLVPYRQSGPRRRLYWVSVCLTHTLQFGFLCTALTKEITVLCPSLSMRWSRIRIPRAIRKMTCFSRTHASQFCTLCTTLQRQTFTVSLNGQIRRNIIKGSCIPANEGELNW